MRAMLILLCLALKTVDTKAMPQLKIWQNTSDIQAVEHKGSRILQIVCYQAGTYQVGDWSIKLDQPAIIQLSMREATSMQLDVAEVHSKEPKQ